MTGIDSAHAEGRLLEEVLPIMAARMNMVKEALSSNIPVKQSKVPNSDSQPDRYWEFTVFPLAFESSKGAVIQIDDVTERVHIEAMMIQSEKMLSLGGLAAGMAHEINNPLSGIIQNIQVVMHRLTWNTKKNLQVAEESGLTMEALQHLPGGTQYSKAVANCGRGWRKGFEHCGEHARLQPVERTKQHAGY